MERRIRTLHEFINEQKLNESFLTKDRIMKNTKKIERALKIKLEEQFNTFTSNEDGDEDYGEFINYTVIMPEIDMKLIYNTNSEIYLTIYENGLFQFYQDATPLGFKSTGHTPKEIARMGSVLIPDGRNINILYKNAEQIREDLLNRLHENKINEMNENITSSKIKSSYQIEDTEISFSYLYKNHSDTNYDDIEYWSTTFLKEDGIDIKKYKINLVKHLKDAYTVLNKDIDKQTTFIDETYDGIFGGEAYNGWDLEGVADDKYNGSIEDATLNTVLYIICKIECFLDLHEKQDYRINENDLIIIDPPMADDQEIHDTIQLLKDKGLKAVSGSRNFHTDILVSSGKKKQALKILKDAGINVNESYEFKEDISENLKEQLSDIYIATTNLRGDLGVMKKGELYEKFESEDGPDYVFLQLINPGYEYYEDVHIVDFKKYFRPVDPNKDKKQLTLLNKWGKVDFGDSYWVTYISVSRRGQTVKDAVTEVLTSKEGFRMSKQTAPSPKQAILRANHSAKTLNVVVRDKVWIAKVYADTVIMVSKTDPRKLGATKILGYIKKTGLLDKYM